MLLKVIGEKPLAPFLADVDSIKMAKIQQAASESSVSGKSCGAGGGAEKKKVFPWSAGGVAVVVVDLPLLSCCCCCCCCCGEW